MRIISTSLFKIIIIIIIILYQQDLPYKIFFNNGLNHFYEFALSVKNKFKVIQKISIDIGSNVGVLLNAFKSLGAKVLGVDPAANICKIANKRNILTLNSFFNDSVCKLINKKMVKQKLLQEQMFLHT